MSDSYSVRIIGYARVSTEKQDWAYQLERLQAAGCSRIFREKTQRQEHDRPPPASENAA